MPFLPFPLLNATMTDCPSRIFQRFTARAVRVTTMTTVGDPPAMPVWRATLHMAVISAASVAAAAVIATGLTA